MKNKETRIMKVTMDAEEFEKYDSGKTRSNHGIRNSKGRLSALPDIEPVTDEDLPEREVVKTETIYIESEKQESNSIGTMVGEALANIIVDVISDPEVQEGLAKLGKAFWYCKVKPRIEKTVQWIKSDKKFQTKASQLSTKSEAVIQPKYAIEIDNKQHGKFTVSEGEAKKLIEMMREEARRLSAMIYLLSNISIKDDKTEEEHILEQAYIKQLLSEESQKTIKNLVDNKKLLDSDTVICFTDFLNGYIRNGETRIAIPALVSKDSE